MCKIEIHGHVTTIDALKYIFKFNIIILRNIFKGINGCVYRFPWICIALVIFVSFIVCFIQVSKARAERDSYNKKNIQLIEKVASYEAAFKK